jgi:hypothetical protein
VVNLSKTPPSAETIKLWLEMYATLDSVEYQLSKRVKTVYTMCRRPEYQALIRALMIRHLPKYTILSSEENMKQGLLRTKETG